MRPARTRQAVPLRAGLLAVALVLGGCSDGAADATPVQRVDWRNGPYAPPCSPTQQTEYVDGETREAGENPLPTRLLSVGYSDFDGLPGDEAVLEHLCGAGSTSLSVWTSSPDGPVLVGEVEPPAELSGNVRDWADDRGVLCVAFDVGDVPDSPAFSRPVQFTQDGLVVLDQSCVVPGVPFANEDDVPGL